jgi:dienelactone hydrolase
VAQLKKFEWVDPSKIYLAGYSEGAAAVALYRGDEHFAGRIIYGWGCTGGDWWTGINGLVVPVLAVIGSQDHYLQSANKYGRDCGLYFSDRSNSRSIVIEGAPHNILRYTQTRAATKEFIETINRL